jgi:arabinofuranosyltransferase
MLAATGVCVWAVVCMAALRAPFEGFGPGTHGIANERAYYAGWTHNNHPVTAGDYADYPGALYAHALLRNASQPIEVGSIELANKGLVVEGEARLPAADDAPADFLVHGLAIGIFGYILGPDVYVIDQAGLAEPVAGRLALEERGRPGHEKALSTAWMRGRFEDRTAFAPADVIAAREALACGDIKRLLDATNEPLTPRRFAGNMLDAFRLHTLRIPPDPIEAQQKFC